MFRHRVFLNSAYRGNSLKLKPVSIGVLFVCFSSFIIWLWKLMHYSELSLFCKIAAQGIISELASDIYSIKYDFMGTVVSNMDGQSKTLTCATPLYICTVKPVKSIPCVVCFTALFDIDFFYSHFTIFYVFGTM